MIAIIIVWVILITTSHHVGSDKVIIVNNSGNSSTECCVNGGDNCPCNSLSVALQNLTCNNTTVNITSESVTLDNATVIGSENVTNTTIIGSGTTVMCNNIGSVSCINCIGFVIEGITWDQCGNPDATDGNGGIYFNNSSNIAINNCTFQNSQTCAVYLSNISYNLTIRNSYFISNGLRGIPSVDNVCGGLKIDTAGINLTVVISDSVFSDNGNFTDNPVYGFIIKSTISTSDVKLTIYRTKFLSNSGGMYLDTYINSLDNVTLAEVVISHNRNEGINIPGLRATKGNICLKILNSTFSNNGNGGIIGDIFTNDPNTEVMVTVESTNFTDNGAIDFSNGALVIAIISADNSPSSVYIQHSNFVNNSNGTITISTSKGKQLHLVYFYEVVIKECVTVGSSSGSGTVSISLHSTLNNTYSFYSVIFSSNRYLGVTGGALFLKTADAGNDVHMINCTFQNNSGYGEGVAFYVADGVTSNFEIYETQMHLSSVNFTNNTAGNSIVYVVGNTIKGTKLSVQYAYFINNNGTPLHLSMSMLVFFTYALFENNTANSGGTLYVEQGTQVHFGDKHGSVIVQFVNNRAAQYGGAIYSDLPSTCPSNGAMFHADNTRNFSVSFVNNKAGIIGTGNSMYFNIHEFCEVDTNVSSSNSLLYLPYKFNYSEAHNTSIVTSPHSAMLYFPNHDGSYTGNETFFIHNQMLGKAIRFTGAVFDYFNNSAEPTQFHVQCIDGCADYSLADDGLLIDNVSLLSVIISGHRIDDKPVNVTLGLTSVLPYFNQQISLQMMVELSPCFAGYFYNVHSNSCVCYNHKDIVECYNDYNEIKRGYWFGTVTDPSKQTVSLCPSRYCHFGKDCKETRQGYCFLPSRLDGQCSSHRTGVACGECKPGYTLAYDSPDCIKTDKCFAGMTIVVIVLTILYWIAIVAVVFGLMYFQFKISSGYAYGIIYYYSIVDILLDNNPYISDAVLQVIAILSSFAKLTPQLFGQLCLVEGLSGIDQQFIHYSHALAVSLILLIIFLIARYSGKFTRFVSPFIIRVICLLLLLSYTSLASTSLQLLRPLTFNNVDEVRTYSSPDIKYFTGRHLAYAIVAILCEVIIVIGLPLLLLLEPLLSHLSQRINFVKIKPLLDEFQGCYKGKYRWFAAYYLICRQVIILIVYVGIGDYYNMLYYLQTACIIIAMIHGWVQPYKKNLLNGLDVVILLILVLVINLNTFSFLSSVSSEFSVVLLIIPLLLLCFIAIRKFLGRRFNRRSRQLHNLCEDEDNDDVDDQYREGTNIRINEGLDRESDNEFQDSLLNYSDNYS